MNLASYILEFIPDVDKNVADAMCCVCRNNMIDQPREYSEKYILSSIMIEKHGRDIASAILLSTPGMNSNV